MIIATGSKLDKSGRYGNAGLAAFVTLACEGAFVRMMGEREFVREM